MGTKTQKLSNVVDQIVEWQSVFTGDGSTGLTAVAGRGYFIDTTSGTVTVTLPASPKVGDIVQLKDYARTWGTNAISTSSALLDGGSRTQSFSTNGQTVTLVYMDGTKGWSLINEDTTTDIGATYISATGGTVTTSGNYKIHTFTGDGCFVVSQTATGSVPNVLDYLVVAGGGSGPTTGGGDGISGGGGAGGFRFYANPTCNPQSGPGAPLNAPTGITASATTYPVTVGGVGAITGPVGNPGSNSIFSTITSTGGGRGGRGDPNANGGTGGSGGGADNNSSGGDGNTPPVRPPQGNPGGNASLQTGGGGGGAMAAGADGTGSPGSGVGGNGGAGAGITGFGAGNGECSACVQYFAGGGGGGNGNGNFPSPGIAGTGGLGGGGN